MQPYPRALGHVWPGHLHGIGCLSARAMDTGFPTIVCRLCSGLSFKVTPPILAGVCGVCVWVRALASPRQSWPGFVVCVFGFGFCLQPANPGWGVGVCVFACALRLYPANPGFGVQCVCSGAGSGFTPPIVAAVCGVCV